MKLMGIVIGISILASLVSARVADAFLQGNPFLIGSVGLQYSQNPGVAFGIDLPSGMQFPIILGALLFVGYLASRHAHTSRERMGFGLILGGGIGNILDRLFDGYVTDFIRIGNFPIFNVADSCITVGAGLLLLSMFLERKRLA